MDADTDIFSPIQISTVRYRQVQIDTVRYRYIHLATVTAG